MKLRVVLYGADDLDEREYEVVSVYVDKKHNLSFRETERSIVSTIDSADIAAIEVTA